MTPTPDPLLTSAAKRLDGAWPVDMDRLEWREALAAIETEAIGLRRAAARDALSLLAAARAAGVLLSATEAKALSAALAQPAPALDVERLLRVETTASILVSVVNAIMPVQSPYGCPHSRDWLNGVLDNLREALRGDPA